MGFIINFIKRLLKLILVLLGFIAFIVLLPLPPYTKFTSIELEPSLPKDGALALNDALNKGSKLYDEKLLGPEAFVVHDGEVYTGLASGEVVKLSPGGHVTFVTKVGQPCTGIREPHKCGRPLGLEIDEPTKHLYVVDAYQGIWKVDLKTDKKQLLVSPRTKINDRAPKLFNSIALAKSGDFYWTDSSSDFDLINGVYSTLADPSGRLFYYNAARNESKVLLDNLWFANGLVISPDHQFVLVSETSRLRIVKYYIDGPKKGKSEIFIAGLPGTPDNLRALPDGSGVLVALYTAFDDDNPLLLKSLSQTPIIRKFMAKLYKLVEMSFEFLNEHFPHVAFEDIVFNTGHFHSMGGILPHLTGLIQLDWNGNVVASYYNTDKTLNHISDAVVYNGKLLTGNPNMQNYVGAVPAPPMLVKAFASVKSVPPTKTAQTVTKEIPKQKQEQVQAKKVEQVQAKPVEAAKPKVEPVKATPAPPTTQRPEVKTTTPKPDSVTSTATPKPTQAPKEPPRTTPPPKPAETTKPTPKPEKKEAAPKTAQTAKQTGTTQKPSSQQTTTPLPKTTPPPKQTESVTTTAKPETKPKPTPKEETKTADSKPKPMQADKKAQPKQIPITEEIPSDTVKPQRETLKVIKKGGPTEIPNPSL